MKNIYNSYCCIVFNRVPAFISWPGVTIPGIVTGLGSVLDILPTVLGLLGMQVELPLIDGWVTTGRKKQINGIFHHKLIPSLQRSSSVPNTFTTRL